MSSRSFLPQHPKIIKKLNNKESPQRINTSRQYSRLSDWQQDQDIVRQIMEKQQEINNQLKQKLNQITEKNKLMHDSLKYYDNEAQKKQLAQQINSCKLQQEEVAVKIKNCQKVEHNTSPQQYYLWQRKKKMDQHQLKIQALHEQTEQQRQMLINSREQLRYIIQEAKTQIQYLMQQIEKAQLESQAEDSQIEGIPVNAIREVTQEYHSVLSTVTILRENNSILSRQLISTMPGMQKNLKKSFQAAKATLMGEIQQLRDQVEADPSPSPLPKSPTLSEAVSDYYFKLANIKSMLTESEISDAAGLIEPYDWTTIRWQQYADLTEGENYSGYVDRYKGLEKQSQELTAQMESIEIQMQQIINEVVKANQENIEIESATNKINKIMMPKR